MQAEVPRSSRKRRAFALTFLDGTSISVGDKSTADGERPTDVTELIASLRRFADDPAAPQPYGPSELSRILAALLDSLHRKSLLSAAELEEALKRRP
jgi:hypothetical protein